MTHGQRLLFVAGQLGMMGLTRFFFSWILKYADQRSAAGDVLFVAASVGFALLVARVLDGVTDPLAGTLSDRWARGGRERRRLLLFTFFIPPAGLVLTFLATHDATLGSRWALLVAGLVVFFAGYTVYAIPYWSLVEDYGRARPADRRVLSNLLGAGLLLAVAIVALVSPAVIERYGYSRSAMYFAAAALALMVLPYFAQPRPAKPSELDLAAPPADVPRVSSPPPPIGQQLRVALRHRRFMAVMLLFCGSQMAFTVVTLAAPFIAVRLLGGKDADVATLMAPFLGTAIPTFLITPWLSRRFGWQRSMVVASVVLAVVYGGTAGLGYGIVGSPMTTAMVLFGLAGPMAAVLLGLEAEAITDCAREAGGGVVSLYFGVFNFSIKALNGFATFATGVLVTVAASDPGGGEIATRGMGILAGVTLVIGVGVYFALSRRGAATAPPVSPASL